MLKNILRTSNLTFLPKYVYVERILNFHLKPCFRRSQCTPKNRSSKMYLLHLHGPSSTIIFKNIWPIVYFLNVFYPKPVSNLGWRTLYLGNSMRWLQNLLKITLILSALAQNFQKEANLVQRMYTLIIFSQLSAHDKV